MGLVSLKSVSVCLCRPLQVSQGNVPGVESASLAMDTEEGVEVVWNEVLFSDKKVFKSQEVGSPSVSLVSTQVIPGGGPVTIDSIINSVD